MVVNCFFHFKCVQRRFCDTPVLSIVVWAVFEIVDNIIWRESGEKKCSKKKKLKTAVDIEVPPK